MQQKNNFLLFITKFQNCIMIFAIFLVLFNFSSCIFVDLIYEDNNFRKDLNRYMNENKGQNRKLIFKVKDFAKYEWDNFFCVSPYSSLDRVKKMTGVNVGILKRTGIKYKEGINVLVFVKKGKLFKFVVYPRCEIDFAYITENYESFNQNTGIFEIIVNRKTKSGYKVQAKPVKKYEFTFEWRKVGELWKKYALSPSSEKAQELSRIIPLEVLNEQIDIKVINSIYKNLDILEKMVLAGDRESLELAFKLINISDGNFSESLCVIIGKTIKKTPRIFLEEMVANYKIARYVTDSILCNLGPDFFKKPKDHAIKESFERIAALKKVKGKNLIRVREICLFNLNRCLSNLKDN